MAKENTEELPGPRTALREAIKVEVEAREARSTPRRPRRRGGNQIVGPRQAELDKLKAEPAASSLNCRSAHQARGAGDIDVDVELIESPVRKAAKTQSSGA